MCRKQEDAWFGGAQGSGRSDRDHRAGGLALSAGVRGTKEEEISLITDLLPACRKSSHEMGVWVRLGGW